MIVVSAQGKSFKSGVVSHSVINTLDLPAVHHHGHSMPAFRLLLHRWRTRYVLGHGELLRATAEVAGSLDQARVTLTLPTSLAAFWLIPRLDALQRRHPGINLQLLTTNRKCDFAREGTLRQYAAFPNLGPGGLCDVLCYAKILGD